MQYWILNLTSDDSNLNHSLNLNNTWYMILKELPSPTRPMIYIKMINTHLG